MTDFLKPEKYTMPFGKYKGMYAKDIVKITQVDKNGKDQKIGMKYLKWIVTQDWFRNTDIIKQIIDDHDKGDNDVETETKEITQEINKPKIKKSKAKESKVTISTENNVLEFQ